MSRIGSRDSVEAGNTPTAWVNRSFPSPPAAGERRDEGTAPKMRQKQKASIPTAAHSVAGWEQLAMVHDAITTDKHIVGGEALQSGSNAGKTTLPSCAAHKGSKMASGKGKRKVPFHAEGHNNAEDMSEGDAPTFQLCGKHITFERARQLVEARGGWNKCTEDNKWTEIVRHLGFKRTNGIGSILKHNYKDLMARAQVEEQIRASVSDDVCGSSKRAKVVGSTVVARIKGLVYPFDGECGDYVAYENRWGATKVSQDHFKKLLGSRAGSASTMSGFFHVFRYGVPLANGNFRWSAKVAWKAKHHHVGVYDCKTAAARAADMKALHLGVPSAKFNFPQYYSLLKAHLADSQQTPTQTPLLQSLLATTYPFVPCRCSFCSAAAEAATGVDTSAGGAEEIMVEAQEILDLFTNVAQNKGAAQGGRGSVFSDVPRPVTSQSGYRGVHKSYKKLLSRGEGGGGGGVPPPYSHSTVSYSAEIYYQGQTKRLGCYPTAEEAARAYDAECRKIGKNASFLNFPVEEAEDGQREGEGVEEGGLTLDGERDREKGLDDGEGGGGREREAEHKEGGQEEEAEDGDGNGEEDGEEEGEGAGEGEGE
eukprot:CAMPEP_0179490974 /NCGR_PEP_ID=MMETSP0799-20121207/65799_1 /TAXON_ID=46947 /ORGANISM="Geminigera cryophila, Strain CCMP2564" /LENGTH=593 /DNA_ID=CAMNT_0021307311 /DNA_START=117 /DNA_END=1898 /DNA_ORIENTATION=+